MGGGRWEVGGGGWGGVIVTGQKGEGEIEQELNISCSGTAYSLVSDVLLISDVEGKVSGVHVCCPQI